MLDEKVVLKSLKALEKQGGKDLFVIVNTKTPLLKKRDFVQRIVPIKHHFKKFEEERIVIITLKNGINNYVELLRPLTSKYENVEIISIKKLKGFSETKLKAFYNDYDYVLCDYRIQKDLPKILGSRFYLKNRKVPYIIKLSDKEVIDKKIEQVNINFVKLQIKSIVKNISFLLTTDTNLSIKVHDFDKKLNSKEVYENIEKVLEFLTNKENRAVTNFKKNEIKSIYLKTGDSISLPVYKLNDEAADLSDTH